MITFIIAIAIIALFPFIMRSIFAVIGIACVIGIVAAARAQPTQTRCYQSGPTRVCETKDRTTGAVTSTSRCYQSGSGQTCDTQSYGSSSSSSTTIPVPSFNPPRR